MTFTLHRNIIAARERMAAGLPRARCVEAPDHRLLLAIEQFNRQEFFECHETLEAMWLEESDDVRFLYQGMLQIGVGYLHLLRGNHHGAVTKLNSGSALLEFFEPDCHSVNVSVLRATALAHELELRALGPEGMHRFDRSSIPTIELAPEAHA